jgi:hypothetical protein
MKEISRFLYPILFFVLAQVCIRWNNKLTVRMIKAVNAHRPPEDQIAESFRDRKQSKLVEGEYHRLYPEGRLNFWCAASMILGFLCFLLAGVMFFKPVR